MDDIRTTKVLCHPDGSLFCNWSPDRKAYAVYMTDEAVLPDPTDLDIVLNPNSVTDIYALVWFEIDAAVRPIPLWQQAAGEFNYSTAEWV